MNIKLTEHFTLSEFERSETAAKCGIDNRVPSHMIPALQNLCKQVLEPLRGFVGRLIVITSGYRCPALNVKVGGVISSQHTMGLAADLSLPKTCYTDWDDGRAHTDMEEAERWVEFIRQHTSFDQCILETHNGRDFWLHVSCKVNAALNRHEVKRIDKKNR